MQRIHLFAILGLTLSTACGDDPDAGATSSESQGGSTDITGISGDATDGPGSATAPTTTGDEGGASESASEATTTGSVASTTTGDSTGPADTTGDETTGGPVDETTGGPVDETTTGGDDTTGGRPADCDAPGSQLPCDDAGDDIFKAIGLGCSDDPNTAIAIKNQVVMAPDSSSYRVATRFGSAQDPMDPGKPAWAPKEGSRFLVIGTGLFPALQGDGALIEDDFGDSEPNGNPDGLDNLPGVMKYEKGSNNGQGGTPFMNCDGVHDCSDTLDPQWNLLADNIANDAFYMSFDLTVPQGTKGYMFDFAYFSEEWPNYVGDVFNDMFVVWSTSETFTGNVTFIENQPLTVTALDPYMKIFPGDPLLAGTGFPGDEEGAGTGWFTATASAQPGETFTVAVSIFDLGDSVWDTVGILDNFRWDCMGCVPSEIDGCDIEPQ